LLVTVDICSLSFFFYCYCDLRHLHSFPTRRSSDLTWFSSHSRGPSRALARATGPSARPRSFPSPPSSTTRPNRRRWRASRSNSRDRKSTRLNSSHDQISYAVFCLKKKKKDFASQDT